MTMSPPWEPSVYNHLDPDTKEIRLLSICESEGHTALIECDLQTFELGNAPLFDALSYVWGNPDVTVEIQFCGSPRLVTENLFGALTRLREKGDSEWIWVDALCINQNDTAEKNHQVPLMRHIYRQAKRVLSWLGQADKDTYFAFSLIERWADAILATFPRLESWPDGKAMREAVKSIERLFDYEEWAAFATFAKKTYWERVWILQEVTLARHCLLICGRHEILFDKLLWAYRAWTTGDLRLVRVAEHLRPAGEGSQFFSFMNLPLEEGEIAKVNAEPSARREFLRLPFMLKRASILSATDGRDKIYGLLGLLDLANTQVAVDYSSDVVDTYRNTILSLVKATDRLDLLSFAGTWNRSSESLTKQTWPSWVPDFICTQVRDLDDRFCENSPFYDTMFFHASGETLAHCSIASSDLGLLCVRGILCDDISAVAPLFPRAHAKERLHSWLSFTLFHEDNLKPKYIPPQQILFRTIIADHLWRGIESPDFLASHLESDFFRMAAGFMVAMRNIFENRPLLHFDEMEMDASEPPSQLDPEMRRRLALWLYHDTQQDKDDQLQGNQIRVQNFVNSGPSRGHLHWPQSIDVNDDEDNQSHLLWFSSVFYRTAPRCLFVTRTGYLGAGPGTAREGHKIFLPLGCSVPLVIRAVRDKFQLVADAYVCGMMQGEVFQKLDDGLLDTQDIVFE